MEKQGKPCRKNPTPKRDRKKKVEMICIKRLSQNYKYNETPHDRGLRLHSTPQNGKTHVLVNKPMWLQSEINKGMEQGG